MKFQGFPTGRAHFIRLPEMFFLDILPRIQHLVELKVCLYFFWRMEKSEGAFRYLMQFDFLEDEKFMQGLGEISSDIEAKLDDALNRCVDDGILLSVQIDLEGEQQDVYFLNSPKGRAAVDAFYNGEWKPSGDRRAPITIDVVRPPIFRLYEENIGALTPLLADLLKEAEQEYPAEWIEEVFQIAVTSNVRSWRYIESILRNWKERGRDGRDAWGDTEKSRRRYTKR